MMRSDASLKGKIKALAKKSNLKPQELLQMYLFEHLLVRLGKSGYAEAFVLKGGLLISSMTGVAQRTTMDMDTTVIGMDMDEDTVSEAVAAICAVDVADGMEYSFERIEPIREGDEYANWRAHLRVRCGKIDAPVKIDITTGDEIVPGASSTATRSCSRKARSGCSRTRSKPCWPKSSRRSFPGESPTRVDATTTTSTLCSV